MPDLEDQLTIAVDFNDVDEDGRQMATLRFASSLRRPDVGERAYLYDDEGNGCWGDIEEIDDLIVYLELDRTTWNVDIALEVEPTPRRSAQPSTTSASEVTSQLV